MGQSNSLELAQATGDSSQLPPKCSLTRRLTSPQGPFMASRLVPGVMQAPIAAQVSFPASHYFTFERKQCRTPPCAAWQMTHHHVLYCPRTRLALGGFNGVLRALQISC